MEELRSVDNKVTISAIGIKNHLKNVSVEKSICEYIWNGFDSGATIIKVNFERRDGNIKKIIISDNGKGIEHGKLHNKFKPFLASSRRLDEIIDKHHSLPHGTRGVGRLTFFTYAQNAKWSTVFELDEKRYKYPIEINERTLGEFDGIKEIPQLSNENVGTVVLLSNLEERIFDDERIKSIIHSVTTEFCWLLELFKHKDIRIFVDDNEITYKSLIDTKESYNWNIEGIKIEVCVIVWKEAIGDYSCFYYQNPDGAELYKETTKLNKKGDGFNHSVFIKSTLFNDFSFETQEVGQSTILPSRNDTKFKKLMEKVREVIRKTRKPFLRSKSIKVVESLEAEGVLPKENIDDAFASLKESELKEAIQDLYAVEPRIFSNLNPEQKKILVRLLNLLLSSDERDNLFNIISQVVSLDSDEKEELCRLFSNTSLTYVIKTLNMITDRLKKVEALRQILYDNNLEVKEHHVQELVEEMTWLFGEKYAVYASVEEDFTQLLLKFRKIAFNSDDEVTVQSEDKRKQVDLYLFRQQMGVEVLENMIVELKRPSVILGDKQFEQIKKYAKLVINEQKFNGGNIKWDFILVGNSIDKKSEIVSSLNYAKSKGEENGVVLNYENYRIFIKTWSEIFTEFSLRHEFINKELKIKRTTLTMASSTADEIVDHALFGISQENAL